MEKTTSIDILKLVISVLVCQLAGFVGSIFTRVSVSSWYVSLSKPSFTPPSWVFGPVWITLYALIGISAFLVWSKEFNNREVKAALIIFGIQLILNAFWSAAFFGLRSPLAGLIVIVILWLAILVTILRFLNISTAAGLLLVPYILWVSFATVLNLSIFLLNK